MNPSFKVYQAYVSSNDGKFTLLIRDYVMNPHRIRGWLVSYQYVLRFDSEPTEEQLRAAVKARREDENLAITAAEKFERNFNGKEFQ